eukprot:gnl/Chilomastix_caulleri/1050.p1 GENE.gnl/Chilomastix_caulleri/1050~~gnl/Chilomastix_caulleri/1050.p1  ORF type:complete len:121 (+),score=20.87 gnl/Chilomastix_caulleri/1050:61-423(+)
MPPVGMCAIHHKRSLLYCKTCGRMICSACKTCESHEIQALSQLIRGAGGMTRGRSHPGRNGRGVPPVPDREEKEEMSSQSEGAAAQASGAQSAAEAEMEEALLDALMFTESLERGPTLFF